MSNNCLVFAWNSCLLVAPKVKKTFFVQEVYIWHVLKDAAKCTCILRGYAPKFEFCS